MPVLEVRRVRKAFGSLVAVAGIDLTVDEGEIVGIAGPNGAGKTTFFNTITGIPFGPDKGSIWLGGRRIDRLPAHSVARAGIARTFQKETSFPTLTVRDNVHLAARYGRRERAGAGRAVSVAIERFDLGHVYDQPARNLPLYEKKRLMLASAVVMQPSVLLLDEPASGLNQIEVQELDSLIGGINQDGVSIVLIEHVLPLLMSVSQRVVVMDGGAILAQGSADEIVRNPAVIEAYLGPTAEVPIA